MVPNGKAHRQTVPARLGLPASRIAAIYCRVSSDEQRDNQTIETQIDTVKRWVDVQRLIHQPIEVYDFYLDDGVSGTIPLAERPAGQRLLRDAASQLFHLVLTYKIDRLGRDPRDILNSAHQFDALGVAVKSLSEDFDLSTPAGKFMFNIFASTAGFARDSQIERSIEGTNHWAREGVWMGGIVPYGYCVTGKKKQARLLLSETPLPGLTLSEADVVRLIYRLMADEGWSCIRIAAHLNALGVPPSYVKDQREVRREGPDGKRKVRTSGLWRYPRIRNLVVNPVYKGEHIYGKRSKKSRELIPQTVPAIVDHETWERAQQTLIRLRFQPKHNAKRQYLLRGIMVCSLCGLRFYGQANPRPNGTPDPYYSCGGKMAARRPLDHKCQSKYIRAQALEEYIWAEIVDFLKHPGAILAQLAQDMRSRQIQATELEQERIAEAVALSHKEVEKQQILDLYRRGHINMTDLTRQFDTIAQEEAALKARLAVLDTTLQGQEAIQTRLEDARDLLETLRKNLKEEFTWEEKRALVETLVLEIRVDTVGEGRAKQAKITVEYAFGSQRLRCAENHTNIRADSCATLSLPVQLPREGRTAR